MVVVVSTKSPKLQSPRCPVLLRLARQGARARGGSSGWARQPRFPSCRPGSLSEGLFCSPTPQTFLEVPRKMPQSRLVAKVGRERRQCWSLLLPLGALSTVPKIFDKALYWPAADEGKRSIRFLYDLYMFILEMCHVSGLYVKYEPVSDGVASWAPSDKPLELQELSRCTKLPGTINEIIALYYVVVYPLLWK